MFKKTDWIFGSISIFIGAATLFLMRGLISLKSMDPAGPAAMPTIVAWLMILIGVIHVTCAVVLIKREGGKSELSNAGKKDSGGTQKVVMICVACVGYYFLLEKIGYIFMTPLLITAIMLSVGERQARKIAATSIITTAFLFCVFYFALKVNMPLGLLDSLFN